ncbi:hypothetical protein HK405_000590 [Cladochytrium tenue]|nr:hypothetical protein HK405_000590 [Cladochytrium tenue]
MERKAASEDVKQAKAAAQRETEEAAAWSKGAKANKKEDEERKRQEALAKKAERDALLAAEEAEVGKKKPTGAKGGSSSKSGAAAGPRVGGGVDAALASLGGGGEASGEAFVAGNLDDALQLLEIANRGGVEGAAAAASGKVERHAEKRVKSAWAAYEERELPLLKAENPGLRLSQLKQMLQKKWKKAPENPMNSAMNVSYNATRDETLDHVQGVKEDALERMREK